MSNEFGVFKINFVCPSQISVDIGLRHSKVIIQILTISSIKPTKFLCAFILFLALSTNNLVSKIIMEKAWGRKVLCRGAA